MKLTNRVATSMTNTRPPKRRRKRDIKRIQSLRVRDPSMTPERAFGSQPTRRIGVVTQQSRNASMSNIESTLDGIYSTPYATQPEEAEVAIGSEVDRGSKLKKVTAGISIVAAIFEIVQLILMLNK